MTIDLLTILCACVGFFLAWKLFDKIIFPTMVYNGMKEIERNPKWVTSQLGYYGFQDIDIVVCESRWGMLPRFRIGKHNRLELWIDTDTSTQDVESIGRLALATKIRLNYGIWFPEKPLYWLSILCYMLDGGDIKQEATSWKEEKKGQ